METNDNINFVCKVYSNVRPLYDLDNFTSDNIVVLSLILMIIILID